MNPDLMNATEVMRRFGISPRTWFRRKAVDWDKQFEVSRPIGQRRYSRVLVEQYVTGQSISTYGKGGRKARG